VLRCTSLLQLRLSLTLSPLPSSLFSSSALPLSLCPPTQVEKIFKQSAEFCSEHEVWKLNVAHVFFMQENKFKDAIRYYEPAVKRQAENGSVGTHPCAPMHRDRAAAAEG
jgi:hypothetical protein